MQGTQSFENVVGLVILGLSRSCQNLQRLCAGYIQGTCFLIKQFLSCNPADIIQDVLPASEPISSSYAIFLPLLISSHSLLEFLISFSNKSEAEVILISLYQSFLVNDF